MVLGLPFLRLISSVLYNDEEVVSVGSHHDLVLLCPQPHESEVITRVNLLEHCLGLVNQLDHEARVLKLKSQFQNDSC